MKKSLCFLAALVLIGCDSASTPLLRGQAVKITDSLGSAVVGATVWIPEDGGFSLAFEDLNPEGNSSFHEPESLALIGSFGGTCSDPTTPAASADCSNMFGDAFLSCLPGNEVAVMALKDDVVIVDTTIVCDGEPQTVIAEDLGT